MTIAKFGKQVILTACAILFASANAFAAGEASTSQDSTSRDTTSAGATSSDETSSGDTSSGATSSGAASSGAGTMDPSAAKDAREQKQDTAQQVSEAVQVVQQMERDAGMKKLLQQARGIFIVPDYGRAALVAGVRGGEGVMLIKQGNRWSNPAFYNIGGISIGAQAGAEGGALAMVLNNDKAVRTFMQENNWSLNAEAGLTIANWSSKAQGAAGKGDVTVWADTEGLLAGLQVSVTDISYDRDETSAYYGRQVAMRDVFSGRVTAPTQAASLRQALTQASGRTSAGETSAGATGSGTGAAERNAAERQYEDRMQRQENMREQDRMRGQ